MLLLSRFIRVPFQTPQRYFSTKTLPFYYFLSPFHRTQLRIPLVAVLRLATTFAVSVSNTALLLYETLSVTMYFHRFIGVISGTSLVAVKRLITSTFAVSFPNTALLLHETLTVTTFAVSSGVTSGHPSWRGDQEVDHDNFHRFSFKPQPYFSTKPFAVTTFAVSSGVTSGHPSWRGEQSRG